MNRTSSGVLRVCRPAAYGGVMIRRGGQAMGLPAIGRPSVLMRHPAALVVPQSLLGRPHSGRGLRSSAAVLATTPASETAPHDATSDVSGSEKKVGLHRCCFFPPLTFTNRDRGAGGH